MAILDVIKYGHPTLRQTAEPVSPGEIDEQFLLDMVETMKERDGVGLAATQLNVKKRIIVVYDYENVQVLINPEIIAHSESQESGQEGCLSLPGLQASVPRFEKVIVSALNEKGDPVEIKARGILAIVLQHEIDHLDGILYIDRADLDSLVWLENDDLSELPTDKPATVEQVQDVYKSVFHQNQDELIFESRQSISGE